MEHLFNCHGEWAAIAAAFSSLPFIKMWVSFHTCNHACKKSNKGKDHA